jgi:nicotinamidase-related amidase
MTAGHCLALTFCLAAFGCSATSSSSPSGEPGESRRPDDPGASGAAGALGGSGAGSGMGGAPSADGALGFVVIDVQQTFVSGAANPDIAEILARTKGAFELAGAESVPVFLTFEASTQGDHALHSSLGGAVPPQTQQFIKTTFDATGLPSFAAAVSQSGLSHLVVLGAETDVCVLQTALGLRRLGFEVMLEQDAVFTSEPNTSPALRRMQQAGISLASQADVAGWVAAPSTLPESSGAAVVETKPLAVGVLLNDLTDAALAASSDPLTTQKTARLRELLLVSEWFELPVYTTNPSTGLPASLSQYYLGQLHPAADIAQDTNVEQLVIAGTDGGLGDAFAAWSGSRQLFVMEDALVALGSAPAQRAILSPQYDAGVVPTTYKSFYYDMTRSVEPNQWPSANWVQRFDEYYYITQAPEDLPPMPPS